MIGTKSMVDETLGSYLKFAGYSYVKELGTKTLKETVLLAYIEKLFNLGKFMMIGPRFLYRS